jgi:hypothetical protein
VHDAADVRIELDDAGADPPAPAKGTPSSPAARIAPIAVIRKIPSPQTWLPEAM